MKYKGTILDESLNQKYSKIKAKPPPHAQNGGLPQQCRAPIINGGPAAPKGPLIQSHSSDRQILKAK